tara:strand:+ start:2848 stop:3552 length:705 start_codon:yes stop_codon:yes gene_type:complete
MNYTFIFDIDGTITPMGLPIEFGMENFLVRSMSNKRFYLVTGSDYEKALGQVGNKVMQLSEACFACCGTKMYERGDLSWSFRQKFDKGIYKYLQDYIDNSDYPHKYGNHIVDRETMINFSISGRNCPQHMREKYINYDYYSGDRIKIKVELENLFDVDVYLGGTLSVDIVPKGAGKHLSFYKMVGDFQFVFFGDRCFNGGNDNKLSELVQKHGGIVHEVMDWTETYDILNHKYI